MTYMQFLTAFNPVIEAFGHAKFPNVMLERIHLKVNDFDPSQMDELCNLIVDNCEHSPRTSKVAEYANIVRARHHAGVFSEFKPIELQCNICDDLRTVRVIATDKSHETLMLCECTERSADATDWKFPKWAHHWAPLYRREACPAAWFAPEIKLNAKGEMRLEETVEHKRQCWASKVKIAEQFWVYQRNECKVL